MLRVFGLGLIPDGRKVSFYSIANFKQKHPDYYRQDLTTLLDLLATGKIKPIVADQLPLREAAHAHDLLEHGSYLWQARFTVQLNGFVQGAATMPIILAKESNIYVVLHDDTIAVCVACSDHLHDDLR